MTPEMVVVWSAALEREKKAAGLSSPLTTCITGMAARHAFKAGDLTIKWPKATPKFCIRCGKQEKRKPCNGKGEFGPFGKTCKGCRSLKVIK